MSPLYHLQVGSFIANAGQFNLRERRLIMLTSLAPDLDGIFFFNPNLWERCHHTFGHNLFSILLLALGLALYNRARRLQLLCLGAATGLLQVLIDQVTNDPSWRIMYFWPVWDHDFALGRYIAWPGLAFFQVWVVQSALMVLILSGTVLLYRRRGRTFLEFVSTRLDRLLTDFIVLPFTSRCQVCGQRASYRLSVDGRTVCGVHGRVQPNLTVLAAPAPGSSTP